MGSSVYPAASSGGSSAPFAKGGALVSSGAFGNKGFFLSETLPAGNYIVSADVKDTPNQYEAHVSVNAPNSNVWIWGEASTGNNSIRVTLTESDKIAVCAGWAKIGTMWGADESPSVGINSLGSNWYNRSYNNNKFYNTDKYFSWWGDQNNSSGNRISYHNFADLTNFDVLYTEHGLAVSDDANLGNARPQTAGGIVGNYAYFSFTNSPRLWRANLNTPTTWTVGTYAAATTGMITSIAYDGTTYVLVTQDGHINTSPDFSTWTKQTSPATAALRDVTYAGGQFVAVGFSGNILTSPNGFAWTKRTAPAGISQLYNINYINGTYIAFGGTTPYSVQNFYYGGVGTPLHVKSTDGITWTAFDITPTKRGNNNTNALRYTGFQDLDRHDYENSSNRDYGRNNAYVYDGWLYTDLAHNRKFVTNDGINWYCLYRFWTNRYVVTSPTHGQMEITGNVYANERPSLYISAPQNSRVYIYAETD